MLYFLFCIKISSLKYLSHFISKHCEGFNLFCICILQRSNMIPISFYLCSYQLYQSNVVCMGIHINFDEKVYTNLFH